MTAPAPLPSDLIQQPRTPISGNGKQLVTLADVWNAALLQSIAHTWNVTAEYPTDLYIPRRAWMQTTAALLRERPSAAELVDFSEEREALDRLQQKLTGPNWDFGSPEWFDAIPEIPFDTESDEESPLA